MIRLISKLKNYYPRNRVEYLGKIAAASTLVLVGGGICIVFAMLTVLYPVCNLLFLSHYFPGRIQHQLPAIVAGTLTCALTSFLGNFVCRFADREADKTPFVPTLPEQLAVLHDDHVLVRGSDRPDLDADDLVRSAQPLAASDSSELLHTINAKQDPPERHDRKDDGRHRSH